MNGYFSQLAARVTADAPPANPVVQPPLPDPQAGYVPPRSAASVAQGPAGENVSAPAEQSITPPVPVAPTYLRRHVSRSEPPGVTASRPGDTELVSNVLAQSVPSEAIRIKPSEQPVQQLIKPAVAEVLAAVHPVVEPAPLRPIPTSVTPAAMQPPAEQVMAPTARQQQQAEPLRPTNPPSAQMDSPARQTPMLPPPAPQTAPVAVHSFPRASDPAPPTLHPTQPVSSPIARPQLLMPTPADLLSAATAPPAPLISIGRISVVILPPATVQTAPRRSSPAPRPAPTRDPFTQRFGFGQL